MEISKARPLSVTVSIHLLPVIIRWIMSGPYVKVFTLLVNYGKILIKKVNLWKAWVLT